MSRSGKVQRTFEFLCVFGAAEKNKEKVEASQQSSLVDKFFPELDKNPQDFNMSKVLNSISLSTLEPTSAVQTYVERTPTQAILRVRSVIGQSPPYLEFNAQHEVKIISRSTLVELVAAHI